MKNIITLSLIFLFAVSAYGKESVLYHEIQQAKLAGVHFENVALKALEPDADVSKYFEKPEEVFFYDNIPINLKDKHVKAMTLSLPTREKNIVLELKEVPDDVYDYTVFTSDGNEYPANRDIKHYRGIVQNETNSLVAITFYHDEIIGLVCTNEGNFDISKSKQSGKHVFYNSNNLKEQIDFVCETNDDHYAEYPPEVLLQERNTASKQKHHETFQAAVRKLKFHVETEYDIYQNKGNSWQNVEAFIAGLFNQVGILYQNEDIWTGVSYMYIWNSNDPYTGTDSETLLDQFNDERTEINGNLGILLTTKNIGGRAKVDQLCATCWPFSSCNKPAVAGYPSTVYALYPNYSRFVKIVAHELGHSIGSPHTHKCAWYLNGSSSAALDGCWPVEKGGTFGTIGCAQPGYPANGGTIMSYCDQAGRPGVPFVNGFGEQPGNLLWTRIHHADCLECEPLIRLYRTFNAGTYTIIDKYNSIQTNDVTVKSGATLKLEPCTGGSVTINPGLKVEAGASFIIK